MKSILNPRVVCAVVGLLVAWVIIFSRVGELVDLQVANFLWKKAGTKHQPSSDIVLVTLDELLSDKPRSELELQEVLSRVLKKCTPAASVAVDFFLKEEGGDELIKSIQAQGRVALSAMFQSEFVPSNSSTLDLVRKNLLSSGEPVSAHLSQFLFPAENYLKAGCRLGHSRFFSGEDHLVRQFKYFIVTDEGVMPALPIAALMMTPKSSLFPYSRIDVGSPFLSMQPHELLFYHKAFSQFSSSQLLEGEISEKQIAGKIVLIGFSPNSFHPGRATPLGAETSTLTIHATALSNWLQRTWIQTLGTGRTLVIAGLFGIFPALVWKRSIRSVSGYLVGLILFYHLLIVLLFYFVPLRLPWAAPMSALFCALFFRLLENILQERTLRLKLEQIQQSRQIFATMLLHDVNTPVNNMIMLLDTIQRNPVEPKNQQRIQHALMEGERANRLLYTLLDIERMESGKLELKKTSFSLRQLVEKSVQSLLARAEQKKLKINIEVSEELTIQADQMILERVLMNLLENAIQFASSSTTIECIARRKELHSNGGIVFSVANEGPMIQASEQKKLFEPFSQLSTRDLNEKRDGFGLGIAFCKLAIEAHGGRIRCVSPAPGKEDGVCFEFEIPVRKG